MTSTERPPTKRELAREQTQKEILRVGRDHLGTVGAAALSLRAVARDLGMVSSAIYRYVDSRDELLTRLIDDSYNSLGEAVEHDVASTAAEPPVERWVSAASTVRTWALDHPHDYSLLFGSPVPGYEAPATTAVSGTRASRALISIVRDAAASRRLRRRKGEQIEISEALRADFEILREEVDLDVPDGVVLDVLIAWSHVFGLVNFELFNQTRGVVTAHADLFEAAARRLAATIGLR